GKVDGFFNNAGVEGTTANVEDYPLDTFEFVLDVNVKGAFLGLKYVVPVMKKQGYGSIVNTASGAGLIGSPGMIGYNTSKHAVIGMTRVVASEVASANIRVNAVAPGVINSKMMRRIEENTTKDLQDSRTKLWPYTPLTITGTPKESANYAHYFSYYPVEGFKVDGYAASGYLNKGNKDLLFNDPIDDKRAAALTYASLNGYVKGYDTGDFGSYEPLKREHVAVILDNILDLQAPADYHMVADDVDTDNY